MGGEGTPIFSLSEYPSRNGVLGFKHDVQFYYLTSRAGCLFECLLALSGMVFICVTNNVFFQKNLISWSWFQKLLYSVCETA